MKFFFIFVGTLVLSTNSHGVPDPVITGTDSYQGYGTIAGKLKTPPEGNAVGISVRNGGVTYSTVTDKQGYWAIVIRHLSTTVEVQSWDQSNANGRTVRFKLNTARLSDSFGK